MFVAPAPQTPRSRSGHGSSADEACRDAAERPYHDYAARGSADVRYEAVDSEERRFGSSDSDTTVQYAPGAGTRPLLETELTFGATKGL